MEEQGERRASRWRRPILTSAGTCIGRVRSVDCFSRFVTKPYVQTRRLPMALAHTSCRQTRGPFCGRSVPAPDDSLRPKGAGQDGKFSGEYFGDAALSYPIGCTSRDQRIECAVQTHRSNVRLVNACREAPGCETTVVRIASIELLSTSAPVPRDDDVRP